MGLDFATVVTSRFLDDYLGIHSWMRPRADRESASCHGDLASIKSLKKSVVSTTTTGALLADFMDVLPSDAARDDL